MRRLPLILALPVIALLLAACAGAHSRPSDGTSQGPDDACREDRECVVKDVGSCCGYRPACVNRDRPTFPEQVRARCLKQGQVGVCGFPDITACRCVERRCVAVPAD